MTGSTRLINRIESNIEKGASVVTLMRYSPVGSRSVLTPIVVLIGASFPSPVVVSAVVSAHRERP